LLRDAISRFHAPPTTIGASSPHCRRIRYRDADDRSVALHLSLPVCAPLLQVIRMLGNGRLEGELRTRTQLERVIAALKCGGIRSSASRLLTRVTARCSPLLSSAGHCFDGQTRLCHIRGKMRKKVWVNQVRR